MTRRENRASLTEADLPVPSHARPCGSVLTYDQAQGPPTAPDADRASQAISRPLVTLSSDVFCFPGPRAGPELPRGRALTALE